MPSHWTYEEEVPKPDDDLYQGDILRRAEPLLEAIGAAHGHFCDGRYLGFVVVSQTCDLVIRGGSCKAAFINLAVIRSLEELMPSLLEDACGSPAPGVYYRDALGEAKELIARIINQNEQALGLFYLEQDGDLEIAVGAVALLRVTIPLDARQYYATIRAARVGRLRPSFRNKLGWLAGNLYSRVDTPDWPESIGKAEAEKKVDKLFSDIDSNANNLWVQRRLFQIASQNRPDISELPKEEIAAEVARHKPKPALESALDRLRHVGPNVLNLLIPDDIIGAASQLRQSSSYALVTAAAAADVLRPLCEPGAAFEFTSRVAANPRLKQAIGDWVAALGEDFSRVKGPRNFNTLRSMLAARPVFNAEFLSIFAESAEGCGLPEGLLGGVEETLLALKPNEAMSDGLITAVTAASTANLAGRFASALQRDSLFKGAFSESSD